MKAGALARILRIAWNDVRLTVRDKTAFIWMLLLPLAMMWMFGHAMGGRSQDPPKITLTVCDRDGGWLARAFVAELEDDSVNLNELPPGEFETTENKVRSLIVPAGFTSKVLAGEQQTLKLVREPGSDAEFGLAGQMHVVRAIVRTLGRLTELTLGDGAGEPAEAEFLSLAGRERLVELDVSMAGRGRPVPTGFAQSVPGILTMTVLMMTLIYGAVFLTLEKQRGMLRRQVTLPVRKADIYLGKLTGRLIIAGLQLAVLVAAGSFLFGLSWGRSPLGLALVLVSLAIAVAGLATFLGAVLSTPNQASGIGWLLSMVLAALGGCWWPAEVMPSWLRTASHALPTAWAMDGFHALISFGRGLDAVLLPAAVLLGFGLLFSLLGARFLRPV